MSSTTVQVPAQTKSARTTADPLAEELDRCYLQRSEELDQLKAEAAEEIRDYLATRCSDTTPEQALTPHLPFVVHDPCTRMTLGQKMLMVIEHSIQRRKHFIGRCKTTAQAQECAAREANRHAVNRAKRRRRNKRKARRRG